MNACRLLALLAAVMLNQSVRAATDLADFSASMSSFTADFTQTVYDSDSVVLQESNGQVSLMRPGRFRWSYDQPVKQLIVADGLTLWVYDEDIQQVTMQPQSATLGSAPIGLLSGEREIESEFSIVDLGLKDELHWFQLEPRVQDTDFNAVYIALDSNGLRAMELRDNFGQATQIKFANFKKNAEIAPDQLQFVPPANVDVVGEAGTAALPQDQIQEIEIAPVDSVMPEAIMPHPAVDTPEVELPVVDTPVEQTTTLPADSLLSDIDPDQLEEPAEDTTGLAGTLPLEDTDRVITFQETIVPAE